MQFKYYVNFFVVDLKKVFELDFFNKVVRVLIIWLELIVVKKREEFKDEMISKMFL